ncbi:MAG: cytidylate kinase-like family protein [Planctomycetes bacterium]|nr:cytidylate kinase-like family protein [Planctomycetota bacterium]
MMPNEMMVETTSVHVTGETPLHGFRGAITEALPAGAPLGLSVAISREAGARGASIAKRAGEKLGWDVYTQDMLEFSAQNGALLDDLRDRLTPDGRAWIDERLDELLEAQNLSQHPNVLEVAKLVLALGAQGNVILLGRGAGFILPSRTTLHVRLVAPLADRVAYMSQWLRLTEEEAADQVRTRDHRRNDFVATHFHRKPNDIHLYDMLLNTSLLGEEKSADLIVAAAKAKMTAVVGMD